MAENETACAHREMQHQLVQDCPGTTPPDHQSRLPLTPPATAERPRQPANALCASALVRLLETINAQRKTDNPASWVEVSVERDLYISHRERIERSFKRSDYDPNRGLLNLRMPSPVHEFFANILALDLQVQLLEIATQDNDTGIFASKIRIGGSATIQLAEGDSESFQTIRRQPDAQFRHANTQYPGVVIEVSYSQDGKNLRKLAQDYILYSNGDIKAVVGIDLNYAGKESTISLWRPEYTRIENDDVEELGFREVISYETFRSVDGYAHNAEKYLKLTLGDFATDALSASHESVPLSISYSRLFDILQQAEEMEPTKVANVADSVVKSRRVTRKRRLSSSSAEQLRSEDEANYAYLEKAAIDRAERDDEDFEERRHNTKGTAAWLLPAEELLEQEVQVPETARSIKEFMWRHGPSGRWKTEKLSSLLAREIGAELGLRMGTARYRIVVIEMGRVVEGLVMGEVEKRIEGDGRDGIGMDELSGEVLHIGGSWNIVWDLQSTHGTKTARQHYAVHIGMPGHLHPMLVRKYHEISRLWHSFLEKGDPKKTWGRGWGRARGDEEDEEDEEGNKKRPDVEDIKAESLAALRQLEGSGATWLSAKQEECMHAIMRLEGARHLICVLRTGAGKSNLFMAPALMRGRGTTVVVVPFSTLIDDLVKRTKEKGVDVVQFRSNQVIAREALPYVPRLVIVSADVAVDKNELFMAYMGKLDRGGHLQRIFIDEAHTTITDSSYREQLTKLKGLHRFCRPIIMLTATLMMTMEREFREMLLLPAETTRIIRDRTTKKNARYEFVQVVGREEGAVEKAAVQFIRRTQTSMMSDEKCIVYCKSIDDCREIAEKIGCGCHHSSMSEAQRREAVARWLSGQGSAAMAATAGLGTGLNFRGIVVIVHSGIPYGLVSFIQQTGRGARGEGEVVHCVVLHDGVKPFEAKGISSVTLKDQHAMWTVATAPGCVREQIAMIMDGVMGECCADVPDAVPCCRCEPSYAFPSNHGEAGAATVPGSDEEEDACGEILAGEMGTYALTRRIDAQDTRARGFRANASVFQEDYRQMATDESTVKRWLLEVESKCAACFTKKLLEKEADGQARSMEDEEQHEALGASCPARARGMEPYRQMRKQLRFAAQSCCFTCKLPLDWCKEAKNDKGTPDECVYMDKVLPAITVAASSTRERRWIRDKFDIDPTDGQAASRHSRGQLDARKAVDTRQI
ncbi:recQ family helicase [Metarhizium guizhouense ARSEF 977]|uniref:DNA 3'-5' helicase n=1 Tax=Metarhizium guizhouense (strain ARSEF 977) TaxID=1276136 RepID=A0A0B4G3J3_METGA|nr:recQ family helicase [Metarhizium guizhouense ARSEF 977]